VTRPPPGPPDNNTAAEAHGARETTPGSFAFPRPFRDGIATRGYPGPAFACRALSFASTSSAIFFR